MLHGGMEATSEGGKEERTNTGFLRKVYDTSGLAGEETKTGEVRSDQMRRQGRSKGKESMGQGGGDDQADT